MGRDRGRRDAVSLTPSFNCGRDRPSAPYAASAFITLRNLSSTVSLAFGLQKPRNTSTVSPACVTVTQSGGRLGRVTLISWGLHFKYCSFPSVFCRNRRFQLRFVSRFLGTARFNVGCTVQLTLLPLARFMLAACAAPSFVSG